MEACTKRKFKTMAEAQRRLDEIADDPRYGPPPPVRLLLSALQLVSPD